MMPDVRSQLIARDEPMLAGRLRSRERPIEPARRAIEARRATTAELFDGLTEAEWARAGTHSELGRDPAERWLDLDLAHAQDHAARIGRARAAWAPRGR